MPFCSEVKGGFLMGWRTGGTVESVRTSWWNDLNHPWKREDVSTVHGVLLVEETHGGSPVVSDTFPAAMDPGFIIPGQASWPEDEEALLPPPGCTHLGVQILRPEMEKHLDHFPLCPKPFYLCESTGDLFPLPYNWQSWVGKIPWRRKWQPL